MAKILLVVTVGIVVLALTTSGFVTKLTTNFADKAIAENIPTTID